jgi:hypothetical protein
MDRLHVTRSYAAPMPSRLHCVPHPAKQRGGSGRDWFDSLNLSRPRSLKLF